MAGPNLPMVPPLLVEPPVVLGPPDRNARPAVVSVGTWSRTCRMKLPGGVEFLADWNTLLVRCRTRC